MWVFEVLSGGKEDKCENTGTRGSLSTKGLSFPKFKQLCVQSFLAVLMTPEIGICFHSSVNKNAAAHFQMCGISILENFVPSKETHRSNFYVYVYD